MEDKGQSALGHAKEVFEAQAKMLAIAEKMSRLADAANPLAPIVEAMAASDRQMRAIEERMRDTLQGAREQLRAIEVPIKQALEDAQRVNKFHDSFSRIAEQHNERLRELTSNLNFPTAFLSDEVMLSIRHTVEHSHEHILSPDTARLVVAGAQVAGTGIVTPSGTASVSSSTASSGRAVDVRAEFDSWIKGLPPTMQVFVWLLVCSILPTIFAALAKVAIEKALSEKEPSVQTTIVNEIYVTHGAEYVEGLRCVRPNSLQVRESPNGDSRVIGRLTKSQAVEVLETRGAWSHIRHYDQAAGTLTEGWAASGYLARYKCY